MKNIMVSIIVLTYKDFSKLRENIQSILSQSYENYEVIIQDDGSPNYSSEYINSLLPETNVRDKFMVETNKQNLGTVRNGNTAIKRSKGDIIVPLSQDDKFADKDSLKKIVQYFCDTGCKICQAKRIGNVHGGVYPSLFDFSFLTDSNQEKLWLRLVYGNFISGATLYWKKSFLEEMGFYDEEYVLMEDHPMLMKVVDRGVHIGFMNCVTVIYGEDGVSSGCFSPLFIKDNIRLYKHINSIAGEKIKSKMCQNFVKYKLLKWKTLEDNKFRIDLKLMDVYFFLAWTKIYSVNKKINLNEVRFTSLWRIEQK